MSWELYLPPAPPTRSRTTGRFMKGHRPANTGKRWSEYMTEEKQKNCAKGWENLNKYRFSPTYVGGGKPRAVVALYPDGQYDCFPSIAAAARLLGYVYMHIRRCCNMNEARNVLRSMSSKTREIINTDYRYRGIRFYFCRREV